MHFNWLLALGLFFASSLLDGLFALYTIALVDTLAFRAASLSLIMYILEAFGIVSYVGNKIYLVPLALGAFTGTYIVIKREAWKKQKKKLNKFSSVQVRILKSQKITSLQ